MFYGFYFLATIQNEDILYSNIVFDIMCFREWTDNFSYDFLDDLMIKCLNDMTKLLMDLIPELRRDVTILRQNLFSKVRYIHDDHTSSDFVNYETN